MKKRGFGKGKFNSFGGKVNPNETITDSAIREIEEECGLKILNENIKDFGKINFYFSAKPEWNQIAHLFLIENYDGKPVESDEMKPEWFDYDKIPYTKMWKDDPL